MIITIKNKIQEQFNWCYFLDNGEQLQAYALQAEQWFKTQHPEQGSLWSSHILLIRSDKTHFMCREFPADLIQKADLHEAIKRDIESWSPWGKSSQFYAWPIIKDNTWSVAVWVWDLQYDAQIKKQAELQGINLTHCLPQQAWYAHCAKGAANTLVVVKEDVGVNLIYMNDSGLPAIIATIADDSDSNHFRRLLGSHYNKIKKLAYQSDNIDLPDWLNTIKLKQPLQTRPGFQALLKARIADTQQFNIQLYRSHALALISLFVVWFVADTALLMHQDNKIQALLTQAEQQAHQVLDDRSVVEELTQELDTQNNLKSHQYRVMRVLAGLTEKLPEYAWLINLREDGSSIEIFGKGKDVSRLAPVFEELKAIEHVAYLADIKSVSGSDIEVFRLKLTYQEALRWASN